MKHLKRIAFILLFCFVAILHGSNQSKAEDIQLIEQTDRNIYSNYLQNKEYKEYLQGKILFQIKDVNGDGRLELILTEDKKDSTDYYAYFFMIKDEKVCYMDKLQYSNEEYLYFSPSKSKIIKSTTWVKEIYGLENDNLKVEGNYVWDVFSDYEDSYYKDGKEITMEEYQLSTTFSDAKFMEFYKNNYRNRSKYILQEVKLIVSNKILRQGKTFQVKLTQEIDNVTFESNKEEVVTVDSYGNVKAVGPGVAVITVSFGDKDLSCYVTVPDQVITAGIVQIDSVYTYYNAKYSKSKNDFILYGNSDTKEAIDDVKIYLYNEYCERFRVGFDRLLNQFQDYKEIYQRDWIPARIYLLNDKIIKISTLYYDSSLSE